MTVDFLMLVSLTFTAVLGVPFYIYFREKMLQGKRNNHSYGRKRLIKLVLINIFLIVCTTVQFLGILIGILLRNKNYDMHTWFLVSLFIFSIFIVFYGAGMYTTSIGIETHTKSSLRKHKSFLTQFSATQLFHRPLSHTLVYGGYVIALFILSLLDFTIPNKINTFDTYTLIGLGATTGAFFTVGQIYSRAYLYQFIVVILCTSILSILITVFKINFTNFSILPFFFSYCIVYTVAITFYIVHKNLFIK